MCVLEYVDVSGLVDGCVDVDVNVEQCERLHVHLHELSDPSPSMLAMVELRSPPMPQAASVDLL
jgi:hypothetical protein